MMPHKMMEQEFIHLKPKFFKKKYITTEKK